MKIAGMVKVIQKENIPAPFATQKDLYQCEECDFRYENQEWAERCEAWCREHHSCNLEITARAEENKKS